MLKGYRIDQESRRPRKTRTAACGLASNRSTAPRWQRRRGGIVGAISAAVDVRKARGVAGEREQKRRAFGYAKRTRELPIWTACMGAAVVFTWSGCGHRSSA